MRGLAWLVVGWMVGLGLLGLALPVPAQPQKTAESFFRDKIAPVLSARCLVCHNSKRPRGGLDLTSRAALLQGGDTGPAVVPGQADKSPLIEMIDGPKARMPQRGERLTGEQVADMRRWINEGTVWPKDLTLAAEPKAVAQNDWWSVRPLQRPPVPPVKNEGWVRTTIDAFILARLEEMGLRPVGEVDRRAFLRRAKFDLHGLPPTPEEIEQFVSDRSPDAFERLIDRLLASPHYGERWGRHWLDVVHYADTHGYDKDKRRLWAWLFRDWIIRAFNEDMPYARFVRMQLAGDVLEPGNPDGIIATGFVVAGPWDFVGHVELREGTVEKKKTRVLDRDDMVANTMSTFLSVTAHCARCHDHKFDPISQKEYYQLQAVFAGVERGDRIFQGPETQKQLAQLSKQKEALLEQQKTLQTEIRNRTSPELAKRDAEVQALEKQLATQPRPVAKTPSPTNGWHSGISPTAAVVKWVQLDLGRPVSIEEIRLIPARPTDFRDSPGFGFPQRFQVAISSDPTFRMAEIIADHSQADYPNPGDRAYIIRLAGKAARYVRITAHRLWERSNDYVFALAEVQVEAAGKNVARAAAVTSLDSIEAGRWGRKRLVDNFDSRHQLPDETNPEMADRIKQQSDVLVRWQKALQARQKLAAALIDPQIKAELTKATAALARLEEQIKTAAASNKVYAVLPIAPRPIHRLHRGSVEQEKELVQPAALALLPGLEPELQIGNLASEGERRLALARWITDNRNGLTWRSIVNRVWHYHFGRGLVDTPNDFGKNGSRPTHPELLDWLAVEFRDNGMSFKQLHKTIMLSAAYRLACTHEEANARIDADNRYLWRMNRQRLDAESLRDSVLAVSGQLRPEMGGPGFDLFRFKDDHSPVYDHSSIEHINDPKTFRRTVYRFVVRSVPNPFLECLDCADPNISVPKRNATLTALQALALLNNPFMVKQSEYFAERLQKISLDPVRQIEAAYQLCFARRPTAEESAALAAHIRRYGLANTCRLLFNTNEFMFVD